MPSIPQILQTLDQLYPWDGTCFLNYETPWQLLFATILSAQCTDDRVNHVTAELFKKYPNLESYVEAKLPDLEKMVHSTGFYRAKARNLQDSARKLITHHDGHVPSDIQALTTLSGVGRKTANVVRSHIFNQPCIVVDTHVMRVSRRLGLTQLTCPTKIEHDLMEKLPESHWIRYNQQIITHGRKVCTAKKPDCTNCALQQECKTEAI